MSESFAQSILEFLDQLSLDHLAFPDGIRVMNPFKGERAAVISECTSAFYSKFYQDKKKRHLVLGINPGRLGAGATGLPFTDTKRLNDDCGIRMDDFSSHEPSSVFIYEMIKAFGGPKKFYNKFYISSVCPLGFVKPNKAGREVNFNYYDDEKVFDLIKTYIIEQLHLQFEFGLKRDKCFCLGTGKNYKYLNILNEEFDLFEKIIPLEHPRYIIQYKTKSKSMYIQKYLNHLQGA